MGNANEHAPQYFIKDGKLTRRTFVKGAGVITVASALGFGAIDKVPQALAEEEAAEAGSKTECSRPLNRVSFREGQITATPA